MRGGMWRIVEPVEQIFALGRKCLKKKSPEFVYALGARSISVHDLKCGVRNITNKHSISASDICWSNTEDKLGK